MIVGLIQQVIEAYRAKGGGDEARQHPVTVTDSNGRKAVENKTLPQILTDLDESVQDLTEAVDELSDVIDQRVERQSKRRRTNRIRAKQG